MVVSKLNKVLIQIHAMLVLRFKVRDPERRLLVIKDECSMDVLCCDMTTADGMIRLRCPLNLQCRL